MPLFTTRHPRQNNTKKSLDAVKRADQILYYSLALSRSPQHCNQKLLAQHDTFYENVLVKQADHSRWILNIHRVYFSLHFRLCFTPPLSSTVPFLHSNLTASHFCRTYSGLFSNMRFLHMGCQKLFFIELKRTLSSTFYELKTVVFLSGIWWILSTTEYKRLITIDFFFMFSSLSCCTYSHICIKQNIQILSYVPID